MKKSLIILVLLFVTHKSNAQKFTVKGGLNLAKFKYTYLDPSLSAKLVPSYHFGITTALKLSEKLKFETGILLSRKGTKKYTTNKSPFTYETKFTEKLLYLDLPLTLKYYAKTGAINLYGIFGSYVGVGIWGRTYKETLSNGLTTNNYERNIEWGDNSTKRFDYGLIGGAGLEFKSIQFGFSYQYGLPSLKNYSNTSSEFRNRVIQLSLGYILKKNN